MLQWFVSFPEFIEFSEFLFHLGKTPMSWKAQIFFEKCQQHQFELFVL